MLRMLFVSVAIVAVSVSVSALIGAALLGADGDSLGRLVGAFLGLTIAARYLADMRAYRYAEKNVNAHLAGEDDRRLAIYHAGRGAFHSRGTRMASLFGRRRLQNRIGEYHFTTKFDPHIGRSVHRLSSTGDGRFHDLEMPPDLVKRKGKPKRQRYD